MFEPFMTNRYIHTPSAQSFLKASAGLVFISCTARYEMESAAITPTMSRASRYIHQWLSMR